MGEAVRVAVGAGSPAHAVSSIARSATQATSGLTMDFGICSLLNVSLRRNGGEGAVRRDGHVYDLFRVSLTLPRGA